MMRLFGSSLTIVLLVAMTIACSSHSGRATSPSPAPSDSSGPPTAETCHASKAQWAIGQRATGDLLERAKNAAQARIARFVRPNEALTMEFSPSRLNLGLDARDIVTTVSCG